jgi:hypothetical protein
MDFSVDRCRRRPNCRRLLIYLDTSTFGKLANGNEGSGDLASALGRVLDQEQALCVGAPWHDDEVALLPVGRPLDLLVKTIRTYTLDVRMRFDQELIDRELFAAAREFSGEAATITWREAFRKDPDDPPLKPFQAEYLNSRHTFEHPAALLDEVSHDRATSRSLTEAHLELRSADLDWETVAAGNVDKQVEYLLGPLADPDFTAVAGARQQQLVEAWMEGGADMDAGSPTRKYLRFAHVASTATSLQDRYPAVAADPSGFCASDAVRYLPTIGLFCFLLAALSVDGRRTKPQPSDLHDLWHLTYGLSRCDIVTADKRSCELVRRRNLVPSGVILLEAHRLTEIADAVVESLPAAHQ